MTGTALGGRQGKKPVASENIGEKKNTQKNGCF